METAHDLKRKAPWNDGAYYVTNKNKATIDCKQRKVAAHAFLYCGTTALLFGSIPMRYAIMMQLRFDGKLGFPGGLIEEDEVTVVGMNRELSEEIGLAKRFYLDEENYSASWVSPTLVDHFYIKEYSEEDFKEIEAGVLLAKDWGGETLGIVRVPVHSLHHNLSRKFTEALVPFLQNNFIASAREEMIEGILARGILTKDRMTAIWMEAQQPV
ncbi:U8 snoRNA-decapping enzyme-like isoform X1 [Clavelina lepadiformis]|uniref:U8 snoRNA-decapping enzyme-like isoform X1 n=1 Tax=Clavelina lepadiformis TaxID=159417 RepID=UPI004042E566